MSRARRPSPAVPAPPSAPAARVVTLTSSQASGYLARVTAYQQAKAALADFTAGVLGGHDIPAGLVTGFDPETRGLHVQPAPSAPTA